MTPDLTTEVVEIASLRPHPENYRGHPADQLAHIQQSLREHGQYRNIVVARDSTILAGHGVVQAAADLGWQQVTVIRLDVEPDSTAARKVLIGDNEMSGLAAVDDRALTDHLRALLAENELLGTGFDESMLAALVFVTRPASEIADMDEAAEWAGMPDYDEGGDAIRLVITFENEEERAAFVQDHGMRIDKRQKLTWSTRWPFMEREVVSGIRFETTDAPEPAEAAVS